ncbi:MULTISPECIES: ATP-binding cassette domain-containing protein [unclassified Paenibacillus]|uniref:ATP-binding cassette domain-containing protein n=1 Tax=unclassified Paenibacillus TaxID=185978 RepID=UPI0008C5D132|nr:ATP-binding cassette domain-containing protein [Paenibacillus sp. OK076]SEN45307.1 energy-coupling factor transport system ATP-binding protein [Paenibacillus sp. OK076]
MAIELEHVGIVSSQPDKRALLQDITVRLNRGEITLLLGCTGSGKTTMLQTIAGLKPPDTGSLKLDGQPFWQNGKVPQSILLQMGLVFQFPEQQLFARSIGREFAYSLRPYRLPDEQKKKQISETLERWDSPAGQGEGDRFHSDRSPFALSGGERRRLGLALGTATQPSWLLLDEPSAGLEAQSVVMLLDALDQHRTAGEGAIVATHDLDTFLPHADRVLLLQEGRLVADLTPLEIHTRPDLLELAGIGLPHSMQLAQQFAAAGIHFPCTALTPEEMAEGIVQSVNEPLEPKVDVIGNEDQFRIDEAKLALTSSDTSGGKGTQEAIYAHVESGSSRGLYGAMDPRLKWILYILLVTATMLQHHWLGLSLTLVPVILALVVLPRQALMGCLKLMKPLVLFFIVSTALSGTTLSTEGGGLHFGFSLIQAEGTLLNVYRLFIVTLASLWFSLTTPYGRMVEGLNWVLGIGKKIKLPVSSFALAVSLIFRFIPMIWSEWQRFSLIVRARGKAALRPNTVRVRDLGPMVIPLLMALFQRAEDMTIAMEMRKVRENSLLGARSSLLVWSKRDTWICIFGLIVFVFYIWIRD